MGERVMNKKQCSKLDPYRNDLIKEYEKGISPSKLSVKYGCSTGNIYYYLKKHGVKIRSVQEIFEFTNVKEINNMIIDYNKGYSPRDLVAKYKFARETIIKILIRKDIKIRNASDALKLAYSKKPKEYFLKNYKSLEKYYETHEPWNKKERMKKICVPCRKEFYVQDCKYKAKYCSQKCAWISQKGVTSPRKGRTLEGEQGIAKAEIIKKKIREGRAKQIITKEHRANMIKGWTLEKRKQARERIIKQYKLGQFPKQTDTNIEQLMKQELIKRGYKINKDFIPQFNLNDKFACDFCFLKQKLIVECDGDWWHVNPNRYDRNNIHPIQKKTLQKDIKKDKYITKIDNGSWDVIRFWGSEIERNVSGCVDRIEVRLKST